jgi:histone-lysine N-methyltransferase EZH2
MEAVAMAAAAIAAGTASAGATGAESYVSDESASASGLGASGQAAERWDWNDPQLYCQNMKLRLRQHRQICMGLSDVAGWGAFVNHGVKKDELLGEYTGELITHGEADRRGKVYDRSNSSFLFNLNDRWVLDAQLRGNKLKFANHSAQANCYAKVLMIDGEHRVGIFAKVDMKAGTELFYDYRYEKDKAPPWAKDRFKEF